MEDRIESSKVAQPKSLNDQLIQAAAELNGDKAQSLINQSADVNYSDGQTSVLLAAFTSANTSVKRANHQMMNDAEQEGCVGQYREFPILNTLRKNQVNVNAPIYPAKNTVLYHMCRLYKYGAALFLIENNADVNAVNQKGKSILYKLIKQSEYGAAKFLLEQGANRLSKQEVESLDEYSSDTYKKVEAKVFKAKAEHKESLSSADALQKPESLIEELEKLEDIKSHFNNLPIEALEALYQESAFSDGDTLLHVIVKYAPLKQVSTWLAANPEVDPLAQNNAGETAYDIITKRNCELYTGGGYRLLSPEQRDYLNKFLETWGKLKIAAEEGNSEQEVVAEEVVKEEALPSQESDSTASQNMDQLTEDLANCNILKEEVTTPLSGQEGDETNMEALD